MTVSLTIFPRMNKLLEKRCLIWNRCGSSLAVGQRLTDVTSVTIAEKSLKEIQASTEFEHISLSVCTCATVYLHTLLRMKKAIIVKGTIIYNNSLSKMVFLLSIRQCRFYREAWTEDREGPVRKIRSSSRPPTEVRGFHQTLKQKNKRQSNQKKNPSSHAGYQGIYSFDFKGFEITPREITLGRPFYSKWTLTIIKQGCTHFPMDVTAQNIPFTKPKNRKI